VQVVLKAQINKTDRNDARGIAQMMRVGLYEVTRARWRKQRPSNSAEAVDSRHLPRPLTTDKR